MKKKNLILKIIIFIIIILPSITSASTVMYMECGVHPECKEEANSGILKKTPWNNWSCQASDSNYSIMKIAKTTSNKGIAVAKFIKEVGQYEFVDDCWLKGDFSSIGNTCNAENSYQDNYLKSGVNKQICPIAIRTEKIIGDKMVPVGQTNASKKVETIDNNIFIIYSFKNNDGEEIKIAEGYSSDGRYAFVGGKHNVTGFLSLINGVNFDRFQAYLINNISGEYYKVDTNFDALMVAQNGEMIKGISVCSSKEMCINDYNFNVIADSNDSNGIIKSNVQKWYNEQKSTIDGLKEFNNSIENKKLIDTAQEINNALEENKNYAFSNSYTFENFTSDLNEAYIGLNRIFNEMTFTDYSTGNKTSLSSSAISYIYKNVIEIDEIRDLAKKNKKNYNLNGSLIIESLKDVVIEKVKEVSDSDIIDLINLSANAEKYTEMFYKAILYLNRDANKLELTAQQKITLNDLKSKYKTLADKANISPVVDCETLLGEDLINKINSYLKIIRISVPILLLVYGIMDFVKALFSPEEGEMKKAQQTFMKRLLIAVLIFLVPILVNLLLNLANQVWSTITPGTCGIYE